MVRHSLARYAFNIMPDGEIVVTSLSSVLKVENDCGHDRDVSPKDCLSSNPLPYIKHLVE
jgi:hypothetical protein